MEELDFPKTIHSSDTSLDKAEAVADRHKAAPIPISSIRQRNHQVFTDHYNNNRFGNQETRSGSGSTLAATKALRARMANALDQLDIQTLVDAGCGDCNWISLLTRDLDLYLGFDIVDRLVERDREFLSHRKNHFFQVADIVLDVLPQADAILCRDTFTHLPNGQVLAALRNFQASGSTYLLTTIYKKFKNKDIPTGNWRPLDLTKPPFGLPCPILLIDDIETPLGKSIAVWRLEDLDLEPPPQLAPPALPVAEFTALSPSAKERQITILGKSFSVDNRFKPAWWNNVEAGVWEPETLRLFDLFIKEDSIFVDIGAWVGATVLYGAVTASEVHTFECDPVSLDVLKSNLALNPALNKRIRLYEAAFGTHEGTVPLFNNRPGNSGTSLLDYFGYTKEIKQKHFTDARMVDGLHFLSQLDLNRVSLIKIDIEGGEYDLIPHISPVLTEHQPSVHLSLNPMNIGGSGDERRDRLVRFEKTMAVFECFSAYNFVYVKEGGQLKKKENSGVLLDVAEQSMAGRSPYSSILFSNRNMPTEDGPQLQIKRVKGNVVRN